MNEKQKIYKALANLYKKESTIFNSLIIPKNTGLDKNVEEELLKSAKFIKLSVLFDITKNIYYLDDALSKIENNYMLNENEEVAFNSAIDENYVHEIKLNDFEILKEYLELNTRVDNSIRRFIRIIESEAPEIVIEGEIELLRKISKMFILNKNILKFKSEKLLSK